MDSIAIDADGVGHRLEDEEDEVLCACGREVTEAWKGYVMGYWPQWVQWGKPACEECHKFFLDEV